MVRISEEEAIRLGIVSNPQKQSKKRKYNNQPCEYNGIKFDSKKELDYYLILLDREKRGEIKELRRQVKIVIQPAFKTPDGKTIREIYYLADFSYIEFVKAYYQGEYKGLAPLIHYVDVKGGNATKTAVYKLKKKLLAYKGIYIEEV